MVKNNLMRCWWQKPLFSGLKTKYRMKKTETARADTILSRNYMKRRGVKGSWKGMYRSSFIFTYLLENHLFIYLFIYLFIWLHWVLVVAVGPFRCSMQTLSCCT